MRERITSTVERANAHRYQQELKTLNALDFDDLLLLAVRLLEEFPEVLAGWERRFEFIMVDEFQDTNQLQMELIRKLARVHRNVCVVGDDDQSIYGWRGGSNSNSIFIIRPLLNSNRIIGARTLFSAPQTASSAIALIARNLAA